MLNPAWWTPRKWPSFVGKSQSWHRTDIDAEFGLAAGTTFFAESDFELLFRDDATTSLQPGDKVSAATDLGFVRNSASLVVLGERAEVASAVYLEERRPEPTRALIPSEVCGVLPRRSGSALSDGRSGRALPGNPREHTEPVGSASTSPVDRGAIRLAEGADSRGKIKGQPCATKPSDYGNNSRAFAPSPSPRGNLSVTLPESADGPL